MGNDEVLFGSYHEIASLVCIVGGATVLATVVVAKFGCSVFNLAASQCFDSVIGSTHTDLHQSAGLRLLTTSYPRNFAVCEPSQPTIPQRRDARLLDQVGDPLQDQVLPQY